MRAGIVMPGVRISDESGGILSEVHGQPMLPRSIAPGQSVTLDVQASAPAQPGTYSVTIDLVDQHVCWFEERGSQPLVLSLVEKNNDA